MTDCHCEVERTRKKKERRKKRKGKYIFETRKIKREHVVVVMFRSENDEKKLRIFTKSDLLKSLYMKNEHKTGFYPF